MDRSKSRAAGAVVSTAVAVATVMIGTSDARADVTGMAIDPLLVDSLELGTPWAEGVDWGYEIVGPGAEAWVDEVWTGIDPVALDVQIFTDGPAPLAGGGTDVSFTKSLSNDTGFEWTGFLIELMPESGGPLVVDPGSIASNEFTVFDVTNNPDGSASILFGGGTVGLGEALSMDFTFSVPDDVHFTMLQTPLPVPGSLALLGIAGLVAPRRRRG